MLKIGAVSALAGVLLLVGCGGGSETSSGKFGPKHYPAPAIANKVGPSDPRYEGQFYELYGTWGTDVLGGWELEFLLEVLRDEPEVFGKQFEKFGFIPDPNDDLPIGMKRGSIDPTLVGSTCANCHVGRLPDGRLWFGQPNLANETLRLEYELDKRWVARGNPSKLSAPTTERALAYGPGRFRLDSDDYKQAVPANIPVHYNLAQRTRLTSVGGALNVRSDVFLSVGAAFNFPLENDPGPLPFPDDSEIEALADFMGAHDPPTPPAQDAGLVTAGKAVFAAAKCNSCHHPDDVSADGVTRLDTSAAPLDRLPGVDPNYPSGSVARDPYQFYMAFGDPTSGGDSAGNDPRTIRILKFAAEHQLHVGASDGYLVLNLHGLWASAPYLNNGSVPTLLDLLKPASERPKTFSVGGFQFDTTVPANGNQGHEFGTELSAQDKTALIAYLNSL